MGIYATAWAAKIQQMASHPDLLTLNEEIGVTRMVLENVLGACESELELIAQAPQIQRLVAQVQALVTQCDKIQRMNANIFTEAQLVEIALRLGEEVAACIDDPSTVDKIRAVIAKVIVGVDTKVSDINAAIEDQLEDDQRA